MKQTNNALKYLLAQYRAIFKNAYFKGLVPAVLVTAGLAAGQAQAAPTEYKDLASIDSAFAGEEVAEFDGSGSSLKLQVPNTNTNQNILNQDWDITLNKGTTQFIKGSGTPATDNEHNSILNGNGHNITITGTAEDSSFVFGNTKSVVPKLVIENLGTLTIDGAKVNLSTPDSTANSSGNQVGVDVKAANIVINNGALVNLNNNSAKSGNVANTFLRGTTMLVEGDDTVVNIGNSTLTGAKDAKNTKAVFGFEEARDSNDNVATEGSTITVNGATLNLYGAVVAQNSGSNPILAGTKGYAALIQGKTLNMTDATLNVKANGTLSGADGNYGGAGGILAVHTSTLTNSYLTIEDQATFNLQMREFAKEYKGTAYENSNNGRDYNGSLTIDGGVVVIDGVLRHTKGGLIEIKDGTQLTGGATMAVAADATNAAKNENKLDNAIMLGVYGDAANPSINDKYESEQYSGSFGNSTLTTLRLSSDTLDQFLNSTAEVIIDKNGDTIKDYQGQIVTHHGARIELTDQNQVEISKFTFNNDAGAGHISTTIANTNGSSTIGGDAALIGNTKDNTAVDGTRTIVAANMSIGKSLIADASITATAPVDQVKSGNSSYAFRFEANDLTLGSEKGTLLDNDKWGGFDSSASAIGAHELKAHRSITFIDGTSDVYTLQDDVVLDTTLGQSETILGSTTSATTGTLNGDDVTVDGGSIKIEGGAWTTTQGQAITLADGSLTVAAAHAGEEKKDGLDLAGTNNATYYVGGVATSLTVNGGAFVIDKATDAAAAEPTITVTGASGATALLDLRGTSVTWGSGSVTVAGASTRDSKTDILSDAGEGQLFITGAQFKNFITTEGANPSATKLTLGDDGVLFADGTISGDIDVGTFVTDAAAAGKVYFSGAGTFATTGALSITADTDSDVLALGEGTIDAQSITLNNKGIAANNKGDLDKDIFTVSGGTLVVASGLSSPNSVVEFKSNGASGSILELDTDDNAQGGLINTNLRFSGANSGLDASQGQWAFAEGKDAYFAGGATFNVGASAEEYAILGDTVSLTLDNLNVTGTSRNTVAEGGSLTVNTMQAGGSTFDVQGQFTINGRADIDGTSASTEIDEVKKADDTAGIDLAKATFNVNGPDAQLKLGNVGLIWLSRQERITQSGTIPIKKS